MYFCKKHQHNKFLTLVDCFHEPAVPVKVECSICGSDVLYVSGDTGEDWTEQEVRAIERELYQFLMIAALPDEYLNLIDMLKEPNGINLVFRREKELIEKGLTFMQALKEHFPENPLSTFFEKHKFS